MDAHDQERKETQARAPHRTVLSQLVCPIKALFVNQGENENNGQTHACLVLYGETQSQAKISRIAGEEVPGGT